MTVEARLKRVFTKALGELPADWEGSSNIRDLPGMSSLVFIKLIVSIEKEFLIRFETRVVLELITIDDVLKKLHTHNEK